MFYLMIRMLHEEMKEGVLSLKKYKEAVIKVSVIHESGNFS